MENELEDRLERLRDEFNERFSKLEHRVDTLEEHFDSGEAEVKVSDLNEFLTRVDPDTHVERVTAIADYLVREEEIDPLTVGDFEDAYLEVRIPKPANMSDILSKAENREWIMRHSKEGQHVLWTIAQPGRDAIDRGFEEA